MKKRNSRDYQLPVCQTSGANSHNTQSITAKQEMSHSLSVRSNILETFGALVDKRLCACVQTKAEQELTAWAQSVDLQVLLDRVSWVDAQEVAY